VRPVVWIAVDPASNVSSAQGAGANAEYLVVRESPALTTLKVLVSPEAVIVQFSLEHNLDPRAVIFATAAAVSVATLLMIGIWGQLYSSSDESTEPRPQDEFTGNLAPVPLVCCPRRCMEAYFCHFCMRIQTTARVWGCSNAVASWIGFCVFNYWIVPMLILALELPPLPQDGTESKQADAAAIAFVNNSLTYWTVSVRAIYMTLMIMFLIVTRLHLARHVDVLTISTACFLSFFCSPCAAAQEAEYVNLASKSLRPHEWAGRQNGEINQYPDRDAGDARQQW
jgi:hypothetical protein